MSETKIEALIKQEAIRIGFHLAGICSVGEGETVPFLETWLKNNFHGAMKYMENPKRGSPQAVLPSIRTMVVVGLNYRWPEGAVPDQEGMISKYAWSGDYHRIIKPMLAELARFIDHASPDASARAYVDTGPIVEKHWAQKAGLGWIGKHTNVINQQGSSWFFLGVILTGLALEPDPPAEDHCGTCIQCIEACPTGAIVQPYMLDARLCISYLTIELRESIPRELRPLIGNRIFGCDDCQDVCPWNRFAYAGDPRFNPKQEVLTARLRDYLQLSPEEFRTRFARTNVLRAKYRGFLRNCLVAAGNAKSSELRCDIEQHLKSDDEMIREHAVWALAQFDDAESRDCLQELRTKETSAAVLEELNHWLG
ncbi:tRNA epoxyqueuosine(34) reductase QueG [bacterium]|nr:tRNA epoxyqueuosine(34) reductase QueG [bacterium]MCI0605796.1 tRNA epoxyqueuosine(34) reductase QueG [bacterium]